VDIYFIILGGGGVGVRVGGGGGAGGEGASVVCLVGWVGGGFVFTSRGIGTTAAYQHIHNIYIADNELYLSTAAVTKSSVRVSERKAVVIAFIIYRYMHTCVHKRETSCLRVV